MKIDTLGLSPQTFNALHRHFVWGQHTSPPGRWRVDEITPDFLRAVPDVMLLDTWNLGPTRIAEIRSLYPRESIDDNYDESGWLMELAP